MFCMHSMAITKDEKLTKTLAPPSPTSPPLETMPTNAAATPLGFSVIPTANKLQDIIGELGSHGRIELPQVVVVGSQSSGKSSVLEALVGRDFLPRGNDICTRRPLLLHLLHTKKLEWGEFLHLPGKRFFDFSEIRREILAETNRLTGENKGVSDKEICLKIYSPNVVDITLVDLPGITKVPVGDQPSNIEARIRTMIMSYIKQPSCLILAVTPANSDLANSDALQIARTADPDGHRTIGIITKLDIMDRGTNARNLLLGKLIPLRLGYIGVVNRSQEDILLNRSIKDALIAEEKFFQSRSVYNGLSDRLGIPQLAKKLNQILVLHIKASLPDLKSRISNALIAAAKARQSFGETVHSKSGQGALLLNFLSKYCEALRATLEGKSEEMSTTELFGGARIRYIFQSIFVKSLEEIDPCKDLTDDDIRTAIQNATGPRSALFIPDVPFEVLIRRQISRLLDPSLQCARFVLDELLKISHRCMRNELQGFPVLRRRMDEVIGNFLRESFQPLEKMIRDIVDMEMDYINTSNPNFIGGTNAVEIAMQQVKSSRPKDTVAETDKAAPSATSSSSGWGIASILQGGYGVAAAKEKFSSKPFGEAIRGVDQTKLSTIFLKEPPTVLRPPETRSEQDEIEIAITRLLLRSYYEIVRKNIEDSVPKAIMHFLVNHTKRELHSVFIKKLYREDLFEVMLREPDEVAMKRKHMQDRFRVLQQAYKTLEELPLEAELVERGHNLGPDATRIPKVHGLRTSSMYTTTQAAAL